MKKKDKSFMEAIKSAAIETDTVLTRRQRRKLERDLKKQYEKTRR